MGNESSRESVEAIGTTTSELSAIELLTGRDQTPFDPLSDNIRRPERAGHKLDRQQNDKVEQGVRTTLRHSKRKHHETVSEPFTAIDNPSVYDPRRNRFSSPNLVHHDSATAAESWQPPLERDHGRNGSAQAPENCEHQSSAYESHRQADRYRPQRHSSTRRGANMDDWTPLSVELSLPRSLASSTASVERVEVKGISNVPMGPRSHPGTPSLRNCDVPTPKYCPPSFIAEAKRGLHIFIASSSEAPADISSIHHLRRVLRKFNPKLILVDREGYYISFEDTREGRDDMKRCKNAKDGQLLFGAFRAQMKALPDDDAIPNKLDAARSAQSPHTTSVVTMPTILQRLNRVQSLTTHDPPLQYDSASLRPTRHDQDDTSSLFSEAARSDTSSHKRKICHVCKDESPLAMKDLVICATCTKKFHKRCYSTPKDTDPGAPKRGGARLVDFGQPGWTCRRCNDKGLDRNTNKTRETRRHAGDDSFTKSSIAEALPKETATVPGPGRSSTQGVDPRADSFADQYVQDDVGEPPAKKTRLDRSSGAAIPFNPATATIGMPSLGEVTNALPLEAAASFLNKCSGLPAATDKAKSTKAACRRKQTATVHDTVLPDNDPKGPESGGHSFAPAVSEDPLLRKLVMGDRHRSLPEIPESPDMEGSASQTCAASNAIIAATPGGARAPEVTLLPPSNAAPTWESSNVLKEPKSPVLSRIARFPKSSLARKDASAEHGSDISSVENISQASQPSAAGYTFQPASETIGGEKEESAVRTILLELASEGLAEAVAVDSGPALPMPRGAPQDKTGYAPLAQSRPCPLLVGRMVEEETLKLDFSKRIPDQIWLDYVNRPTDLARKRAEIKARPSRKELFGKPSLHSRLKEFHPQTELSIATSAGGRSNTISPGKRHQNGERACSSPADTYGDLCDKQLVRDCDTLVDVPNQPIPIITPNGELAFRDGARAADGSLPRAKVIYKTGYGA